MYQCISSFEPFRARTSGLVAGILTGAAGAGLLAEPSFAMSGADNPQTLANPNIAAQPFGPDLDGNQIVDMKDLMIMLAVLNGGDHANPAWVQAADVNGDGVIDHADLAEVIANFGRTITPPPPPPPTIPAGTIARTREATGSPGVIRPITPPPPPPPPPPTKLMPGDGFSGLFEVPGVVGNPSAPGADAKAIARWNLVPWQTITGEFNVGVVAFHINGIEKVVFSANGGPEVVVTEMTMNPQSNTAEYWATLDAADFADGQVEIRAIVYPNDGVPRGLQGDLSSDSIRKGEHSLLLYANSGQSLAEPVVYVAGHGSDQTGNGTRDNPYRTIAKGIASRVRNGSALTGESAGLTVKCLPGDYVFGRSGLVMRTNSFDGRWVTVEAADGVDRDDVRIVSHENGGLFANRLRLRGLKIEGQRRLVATSLWLDKVDVNGDDPAVDYKIINPAWTPDGIYVTDSVARNSRNAVRDATYIINTVVETVSGSPFGGATMTVNSSCLKYLTTVFHGDVFHWHARPNTDPDKNIIAYNIFAPDFNTQGIAADLLGGTRFDNVAIVNFLAAKQSDSTAGSWWNTDTNHLLLRGVTMHDQLLRFAQGNHGTSLRNVELLGVVVRAMTHTPLPADTRVQGLHIVEPNVFGSTIPAASDVTTFHNPGFMNPAEADFRPAMGSPLLGRIQRDRIGVDTDAHNNSRSQLTAAGAIRGVNE